MRRGAPACGWAALAALAVAGCAEAGLRLPRLQLGAWLTVSASAGRSVSGGGEVGLVMPLDDDVAASDDDGVARSEDDVFGGDDEPTALSESDVAATTANAPGPEEVAQIAVVGRPARCRVAAVCRWESAERERALATRSAWGGRR